MLCLGIESSCDETSVALVEDGRRVLANEVASSAQIHARYGGVIPEIASRKHLESLAPLFDSAINKAQVNSRDIDLICAVNRPGLIPALLVGFTFAKAIALFLDRPIIAVDHILAHLYAPFLQLGEEDSVDEISFPFIGLIVSGGHTNLYLVKNWQDIVLLGKTRDDAAGEALDKAGKMLGLGYPGGPAIDKLSRGVLPKESFPVYCPKDNLEFSYSGLKTSLYYFLKKNEIDGEKEMPQICADFQRAVVYPLINRAICAARHYKAKDIVFGGGVSANSYLRQEMMNFKDEFNVFFPPLSLCLDNAAMVAGLGFHWRNNPAKMNEDVYSRSSV